MSRWYYSALKSKRVDVAQFPAAQRVESSNGVAFQSDFMTWQTLPDEYNDCDLLYIEPPWLHGMPWFYEQVGQRAAMPAYSAFLAHVNRFLHLKPTCVITGKTALRHLDSPTSICETELNGGHVIAAGYGVTLPSECATTIELLNGLAERYDCVGDFMCGLGRTGLQFADAGKRFVMSDINARCIGGIHQRLKEAGYA